MDMLGSVDIDNPPLGNYGYNEVDGGVDGGTGEEDNEVEEVDGAGLSRRGVFLSMQLQALIKPKIGIGKGWRTSSFNSCHAMAERCPGPTDHYKAVGKLSKLHVADGVDACNK